jgi:hypothetical protein
MIPTRLKTFVQSVLSPRKYMESTFAPFYNDNRWGDAESRSGPGSNLTRTAKLRNELPLLLEEIVARTLLDAPCGDFNWIKDTELSLEGVGVVETFVGSTTRYVVLRDVLPVAVNTSPPRVLRHQDPVCTLQTR